MKIIQVIDQLALGGAERVCLNLVNLFYRNCYDVELILFDKRGGLVSLIDSGVPVLVLDKKKSKFKAYKKMVAAVKDADIIHVHMRQNYRFVRKAFLLFGCKKKVIFHDHYGRININKRVPFLYKNIFKPDYYIGCSELLTDWAINGIKMETSKVFLVTNFVLKYPSKFKKNKGSGLVMIGSLKSVKNHIFAIKLAHSLKERLTIYCPSLSGNYYKEVQETINELKYSSHINFITGCNNVQAELKQYEVALLTSTSEGDPLVIMEYLAQGLPCICSNVGESVKTIRKVFPFLVQDTFDLTKWESAYHKAKQISTTDIENLYDTHFTAQLYLKKYIAIYNTCIGD